MSQPISPEQIAKAFEGARATQPVDPTMCRCGVILREHPELEDSVMDVARFNSATVSRVLKALDLPVSHDVITKHRKGLCRCTGRNQR